MITPMLACVVPAGAIVVRDDVYWHAWHLGAGALVLVAISQDVPSRVLDPMDLVDIVIPDASQPPRAPADETEAIANLAAGGFTVSTVYKGESE